MHVVGIPLDLNWFLQLIFTAFVVAFGLLLLVKNTASKYFEVDANFEGSDPNTMPGLRMDGAVCVVCGSSGTKKCSRCKEVRYCSLACQTMHWKSGHKEKCKVYSVQATAGCRSKVSGFGDKNSNAISLVPVSGTSRLKHSNKILFPYDEFVELFNWDKVAFPPCGLLNCGNSCFANVVLQCLAHTRPLVAYLLEKGHRRGCIRYDWCFLCAFEIHVEKAHKSSHPFSPINIVSRLPNIGGNFGNGSQEDAHEFMRFAIDTMQSVCLDEFGGEKAVDPVSQETTLIQHIFGGQLQSQVICTQCNKISNQYENMMDLTVEIHGDAESLEECLDQFTVKEWLHGDNMYKCDGCNEYVKAWKRLTVRRAPNVLTIALKRFQSGIYGKLNKSVTFPEVLDLSPYMSETGDGTDIYRLYSVVVHLDMLNASYFGHYICYTKDFSGNWYRIDDSKVTSVELEEVLSQGAYMLLYSRVCARKESQKTFEPSKMEQQTVKVDVEHCPIEQVECSSASAFIEPISRYGSVIGARSEVSPFNRKDSSNESCSNSGRENFEDVDVVISAASSSVSNVDSDLKKDSLGIKYETIGEKQEDIDIDNTAPSSSDTREVSACEGDPQNANILCFSILPSAQIRVFKCEKVSCNAIDSEDASKDSEHSDSELKSSTAQDMKHHSNGHTQQIASPEEHDCQLVSGFPSN